MAIQADKSEATQNRIIEIARSVFAREGFAGASLSEIVASANVTTGAVYHHFGGKKGLFVAVAEHVEREILDQVSQSSGEDVSPWDALENGLLATLEICAKPDIQRIVFRDAPNVVGAAEWREIEMKYAFGLMSQSLHAIAANGLIDATDPDLIAQILLGAIMEAAHGIAVSDQPETALRVGSDAIKSMARALLVDNP